MVVAAPVPLDIVLLWYVLRSVRKSLIAYPVTWIAYTLIHVAASALLRYDSLIPAWHLHS